jgi:hypothetical protein
MIDQMDMEWIQHYLYEEEKKTDSMMERRHELHSFPVFI